MEPFRWLGDVTVIQAFESGVLDLKDFYFTGDDYSYKIEIEAKRRFLQLLKDRFNSGVSYKGSVLKWDTLIQEKTNELARYLSGQSSRLDLSEPSLVLERMDNRAVREAIVSLTHPEARRRGIGKSTLHYLRQNAKNDRPFRVYHKLKPRLESPASRVRLRK